MIVDVAKEEFKTSIFLVGNESVMTVRNTTFNNIHGCKYFYI